MKPKFTNKNLQIVNEETKYRGFYSVKQLHLQHDLFNGGKSPVLQREMVLRRSAAAVLCFDPIRDEVVLIRQFRVGAIGDAVSPWLWEIVAGLIEPNENPADLVVREAQEEANIDVSHLINVVTYYPSPGGSNEQLTVYVGRVDASQAGGVYGLAEEGEDIEVKVFSRTEAVAGIAAGYIKNAASIIALQWLELNMQRVEQEWGCT